MAEIIRMPRMSDTMEHGVIIGWLKSEGDTINVGETLAEVETDKATMELGSSSNGVLLYIAVKEGAVPVNGIICIIGEKDEDIEELKKRIEFNEKIEKEDLNNLEALSIESLITELSKGHKVLISSLDYKRYFYTVIITELKKIIEIQSQEILNLSTYKSEYLNQQKELQELFSELEKKLGIKLDNTTLLDLPKNIESHFKEIHHFDKYLKEKSNKIEKWLEMLAVDKTEEVIKEISIYTKERKLHDIVIEITQISSNWFSLKRKENSNIINHNDANTLKSKLNYSLINLIKEIEIK